MAKEKLGVKRICPNCDAKFYDLNKNPAVCPKCEHSFEPVARFKSKKTKAEATASPPEPKEAVAAAAATVPELAEEETAVVETANEPVVTFEEADAEVKATPSARIAGLDEDVEDLEIDPAIALDTEEDSEDVTLLATEDEFDEDVTDIIDADVLEKE